MYFKRFSVLFAIILAFSTFISSFAFAESNVKPNLVALGDSITYGWNLDDTNGNTTPSSKAFPYLIGNGNYVVGKNISGGGWTSARLLTEISKPENILAIKNADVITLDIGSNDFLQDARIQAILNNPAQLGDPANQAILTGAVNDISTKLAQNLITIITSIRTVNTSSPVILYNIYNPFPKTNPALYGIGEQLLTGVSGVNTLVYQQVAGGTNSFLADAYSAFKTLQTDPIIPGDIHPTVVGQQVLAGIATAILSALPKGELTINLASTSTDSTKDPVTITVSTNVEKVYAIQWLKGEKTIEDFAAVGTGTDISQNQFQVTENGTYTVYIRDSKGAKAVKSITVSNIQKDTPPANNPGNSSNNPAPTQTTTTTTTPTTTTQPAAATLTRTATGHTLPNTASPMYNYLAIGLAFIFAGLFAMKLQNRKRENN
ncbi:GDSL-type esterase/lipase family protein [Neobacillus sp. 114]|uniref:GDSL-type esterase/lipase family protein n=1 Tax=Neobacillus sp. 114 TaxID=3048535 RepID=UPI0024C3FEA6|nr:GDSL-type esterase/lipase family protein [Neobacillus sp. 114]